MPRIRFTELAAKNLKPQKKQTEYFDKNFSPGVTGSLGLRVSPGGTKAWFILYRLKNGTKQRYKLGYFPSLSLTNARREATEKLTEIDKGVDPNAELKAELSSPTFKDIADIYLKYHAERHKRPASIKEDKRILDKELLPKWKNRKANDIHRCDAIHLLDEVAERGPVMANRVLALASTIFNVAIDRELVESNPCYRLRKPGGKEKSRKRVLKPEEIKLIWDALPTLRPKMSAIVKLRFLTGQRGGEVCSMRWQDIDFNEGVWTIPEEITKNKIAHRVPLTQPVLDILNSLPQKNEWVFPSNYGSEAGHTVNVQKVAGKIRKETGISDFRMHDLRRTAATLMAEMGVSDFIVGKVLNHSTAKNITSIYNRYAYDAEKLIALEKWASRVIQIVEGKEAKVFQLRKGKK